MSRWLEMTIFLDFVFKIGSYLKKKKWDGELKKAHNIWQNNAEQQQNPIIKRQKPHTVIINLNDIG